jgi:dTDP-4-amino-4,6-dideoxygalactose transaminase
LNRERRTVPLLDLQAQHRQIRGEVLEKVTSVIDSQRFILGAEVQQLEEEIALYCQTRYAIGCASGSDALLLALMALDVGRGDEVLTTPYTFFATAGAIRQVGAKPVFVDVEAHTFNMDMGQVSAALAAHPGIRAIIPVHLFGGCADMDALLAVAGNIPVIEDAAQSIGSEYKGRRAGSMGAIGCFSFFPSKNLGGYGDGGMLTTNDAAIAEKLRALRVHGSRTKYYHDWVGVNSRLDALQAAVLRIKLKHLDSWTAGRQRNAGLYREILGANQAPVAVPQEQPYQTRHIYNQFVIRGDQRDALKSALQQAGIGSEVYYPLPLHLQKCFENLGYQEGAFPVSERLAQTSLALPVYCELAREDIFYVAGETAGYYRASNPASQTVAG